ncbi:MAG: hypothetical protein QOG23_2200 [Blastocatellia bacterium]|nr:hypothetical protein [Blastocatellia bacterium]
MSLCLCGEKLSRIVFFDKARSGSRLPSDLTRLQEPMFLIRRPSQREITEFLDRSRDLPLSYDPIGIARQTPKGFNADMASAVIGHGRETFERAKKALAQWRHYEMGWVELLPQDAATTPGTIVAVLVRHLGFWSLNACRVVYGIGDRHTGSSFGFAYGTLTNHAEMGEEIFEVSLEPESEAVIYRIQAVSRPHAPMAWIGYPIARYFQERFRRDSTEALRRALGGPGPADG